MTILADIPRAMEFLAWWYDGEPYSVGAIDPDDARGLAWLTTEDPARVEQFLRQQGELGRNLYYQPNLCRPDLGDRRAKKEHVVVATCLHADVDPPEVAGHDQLVAWQQRALAALSTDAHWFSLAVPPPSAIVFSGSGFQLLWRLADPVVLWREVDGAFAQDPALVDAVEGRSYALLRLIDPAHGGTHNVDRLLRVPGTLNHPNQRKREKYGRSEPVLSGASWTEARHALESFRHEPVPAGPKAPRAEGTRQLASMYANGRVPKGVLEQSVPEWLFDKIVDGAATGEDRSVAGFAAAAAMIKHGLDDDTVSSVLGDPDYGVSGHFLDQGDADRAIERAIDHAHDEVDADIAAWEGIAASMRRTAIKNASGRVAQNDPATGLAQAGDGDQLEQRAANPQDVGEPQADPVLFSTSTPPADAVAAPLELEIDTTLRSTQRKLAARTDPEALRDAELLRRVLAGEFLIDVVGEDSIKALGLAALAVARAAPPGTTRAQIERRLLGPAGALAADVPEAVGDALEALPQFGPLPGASKNERAARAPTASGTGDFVMAQSGPRAGRPDSANQHNVRLALHKLGVSLRHNLFSNEENYEREGKVDILQDHHVKALRAEAEAVHDFRPSKDDLFDMCEVIAREHAYHPVRDYLDSLPRDQPVTGLAERWLIDCAGAEDTPFVRAVSRIVLVAAVRRVRQPGCKFDEMLVLETRTQGKNKSKALKEGLCPDASWFTDDFNFRLVNDTQKMLECTMGHWIIEAGELKGLSEGQYNAVKGYLSRGRDIARMAYGRKRNVVLREFIVIGTTNEEQYLMDPSGNRRFWPVAIIEFDVAMLRGMRDALWAEAARLDLENPHPDYIRLPPELYAAAAAEQSRREVDTSQRAELESVLYGLSGRISIRDVWKILGFGEDRGLPSKFDSMAISSALQAIGFSKRKSNGQVWYERGNVVERNVILSVRGSQVGGWSVHARPPQHTGAGSGAAGSRVN